jgi:DNA invertase Pin-like site-specific DNA recombinase
MMARYSTNPRSALTQLCRFLKQVHLTDTVVVRRPEGTGRAATHANSRADLLFFLLAVIYRILTAPRWSVGAL